MTKIDEWNGCYPSNWKGIIVPESMAHPAKYSSRLIRRIYQHLRDEEWIQPGDSVIDPFGGVALGALDAMRIGLHWYGCELEPRFVDLGNKNIDSWLARFGNMPKWGSAQLKQGDSRRLLEVLGGSPAAAVSSPPYAETPVNQTHMTSNKRGDKSNPNYRPSWERKLAEGFEKTERPYGETPGQLGAMKGDGFDAAISSPPFLQSSGGAHVPKGMDPALMDRHAAGNKGSHAYGEAPGQLSSMNEGGFESAVSSPPYNPPFSHQHNGKRGGKRGTTPSETGAFVRYGNTDGQLEGMDMEGFEAAVSSPPYLNETEGAGVNINKPATFRGVLKDGSLSMGDSEGQLSAMSPTGFDPAVSSPPFEDTVLHDGGPVQQQGGELHSDYGDTDGNMGNDSGDDFWLAARTIVEQVYIALRPGGHACWVVKNYVKNKKVVPFCDQWRQLCEAVGFITLHEHHAMLVHGKQHTLEGGLKLHESKSFFRRLAEKNGSPRIDYETVFCMVKP